MNALRVLRWLACTVLALSSIARPILAMGAAETGSVADAAACSQARQNSSPQALISNGLVTAVVYLPDANRGYYRGSRFDWSGVVGCLGYKGHTYFGVWFPHYDPLLHDSITGPVEEFRSGDGDSAPFYDQAKPGELFVKPGVGVLRRVDSEPFKFSTRYPIVDGGRWTVHAGRSAVSFRQKLKSPIGVAYVYTKTLRLDPHAPVLVIEHSLRNTGTRAIDTEAYEHNFFMIDGSPTGPEMTVRFPFTPAAERPLGNGAHIDGKQIVYQRELATGESASSGLTGYSQNVSDYDLFVENSKTGVGVEQSSDTPIARMNFWSIRTTICPEAYVHLKIAPGETAHWTIRYRFYAR
jgi:hypothetical protein